MGIFSDILSVGGSLLSGILNNDSAEERQADAQQFSAQQYASRYQTSVADIRAAGLNPGLAYGGISGSPPTSGIASPGGMPDLGASFSQSRQASAQSALSSATVANIEADTLNKSKQGDLYEAQAAAARGNAFQSNAEVERIQSNVKEITSKLENRYYENDAARVMAVAQELKSQDALNKQRGLTEEQSRSLMYTQALKIFKETDLLNLDISAASKMENIGREAGQLRPIIEILMSVIRAGASRR